MTRPRGPFSSLTHDQCWNSDQAGAYDETSKRIKARMLRFEPKCANEYGLSRGDPRLRVSQMRTSIAAAAILRCCIESETQIVRAAPDSVEAGVAMWMRLGLRGFETSG